ncbi:hypothetical protein AKJ16_DCAP03782 [Drosera capensis]
MRLAKNRENEFELNHVSYDRENHQRPRMGISSDANIIAEDAESELFVATRYLIAITVIMKQRYEIVAPRYLRGNIIVMAAEYADIHAPCVPNLSVTCPKYGGKFDIEIAATPMPETCQNKMASAYFVYDDFLSKNCVNSGR